MRSFRTRSIIVVAGLAAIPALAACGSSSSSSSSASASASTSSSSITVTSTDTTCDISSNNLKAGSTVFAVTNKGSQVTEVYVYGKEGDS